MPVDWGLANQGGFDYLQSLQAIGNSRLQQMQVAKDQYGLQTAQKQDAARPGILAAARSGNYQGAQDQAFGVGDMDALKFVGSLQEDGRQQLARHADTMAAVAANLSRLPAEQRKAALAAAAPTLTAAGFTPDEIAGADVSDAGLTGYISAASNTKDALAAYYESQKPVTLADGATEFGATPMGGGSRPVIAENPKDPPAARYQLSPDGSQWLLVPGTGGSPVAGNGTPSGFQGGGGPVSGAPGGGSPSSTPRSVRNNNPGNIEDGAFAKSQPGYQGSDGRFAIFATPQAGSGAQAALLGSYIDRGYNTVSKIVGRWAPPSDGNDTAGYAATVARAIGVDPNTPLTKAAIPKLQAVMAGVEGGGTPIRGGGPTVRPSPGLPTSVPSGVAPKDKSYRILTPQEAQARGLDPSSRWQVSPDNQVSALPSKGDKPLTESQGKAAGYLARAVAATDSLNAMPRAPSPNEANAYLYGLSTSNPLRRNMSPEAQRAMAAQEAFVMAVLRQDSGAAISAGEIQSGMRIYFPQPGDSAETQAVKRRQREAAIRGLRIAAGPGSDQVHMGVAPGAGAAAGRPSAGWGKMTVK